MDLLWIIMDLHSDSTTNQKQNHLWKVSMNSMKAKICSQINHFFPPDE